MPTKPMRAGQSAIGQSAIAGPAGHAIDGLPVEIGGLHPSIPFEVQAGTLRVKCLVTADALEAASGLDLPSTTEARLRSFARFRTLIDVAARLKLAAHPPARGETMVLTASDLRHAPHSFGTPVFAAVLRPQSGHGRAVPATSVA